MSEGAAGQAELPMFNYLSLDANTLYANHWPHTSVELENLIAGCQELGVCVLIPRIVLDEVRTLWLAKTKEMIGTAKQKASHASNKLPPALRPEVQAWPDPRDIEQAYDTASA